MNNINKSVAVALLIICPSLAFSDSGDEMPTLVMKLSASSTSLSVKERPKVKVTIMNKGDKHMTLVHPGDGSESGWRTPIINWSILDANSNAKYPKEAIPKKVARCGNINRLKPEEVFDLAPGETRELKGSVYLPPFAKAGRYRVVFLYTNRPSLEWSGIPLGQHDPEAMQRVKESTKCSLVSNELIFMVKE